MTEYNINDELFDAICEAAFSQYVTDTCASYPSKEETDAMFTIPKKGRRRLKRALKAKKYGKPLFVVYLRRVAVILLVTVTVAFGVLMTNTEVRAAIKNTIIEWYSEYIKFNFIAGEETVVEIDPISTGEKSDVQDNTSNPLYDYEIGYIPAGFELDSIREKEHRRSYIYYNSSGKHISISINDPKYSTFSSDIEHNEYTEMKIDDRNVYLLYDDNRNDGSIIYSESDYIIYVYGSVEKTELIEIFKNIK